MNIYHISYSSSHESVHLHFWGCNMECRACICKKEIYDVHLKESRRKIYQVGSLANPPQRFLSLAQVKQVLKEALPGRVKKVYFRGQEPSLDAELPDLASWLHRELSTHNVLVTNGFKVAPLTDIDEVVLSIKAYTDSLHRQYTGKSNRRVLSNFEAIYRTGIKLRVDGILIPEYIDCQEIDRICHFIASVDPDIPYHLFAYIPVGDNPWRAPTPEEMDEAVNLAKRHLTQVSHFTHFTAKEELKYSIVSIV